VLETRLHQAQAEPMAPIDFLSCLVSDELTRRSDRLLERRHKEAGFRDAARTLDNFDFGFNPKMNRSLIFDLATGAFIARHEDALFLGPGGTGKSHLAQALGHCAVRQGVDVVFTNCASLTQSLNAARAIGAYDRKLASLARVPLLLIDDFGLKPLRPPADEDLHDLIAERYEQVSTVITSNLDFTEWDQAFPANRLLASATLDRMRHNAYCLVLDGQSYRSPKLAPSTAKSKVANGSKTTHS
jgi:DNA replication protein DnaC